MTLTSHLREAQPISTRNRRARGPAPLRSIDPPKHIAFHHTMLLRAGFLGAYSLRACDLPQDDRPIGAAPPRTGIPSWSRLVSAIVSRSDIVKGSPRNSDFLVEARIQIPHRLRERLVEQRN